MVDHRGMAARPVDGDDVESDPARWVLDGGQVGGGELAQAGALGRCHRLGGGSVAVAASGQDLAGELLAQAAELAAAVGAGRARETRGGCRIAVIAGHDRNLPLWQAPLGPPTKIVDNSAR